MYAIWLVLKSLILTGASGAVLALFCITTPDTPSPPTTIGGHITDQLLFLGVITSCVVFVWGVMSAPICAYLGEPVMVEWKYLKRAPSLLAEGYRESFSRAIRSRLIRYYCLFAATVFALAMIGLMCALSSV